MDYLFDIQRLPSFLIPFVSLSYPVERPSRTDSFHDAVYYDIGYLDTCFIVTLIAVMAILRDVARLFVLEPFARWKLTRDWRLRQGCMVTITNGKPNGNGASNRTGSLTIKSAERLPEDSAEAKHIHRSVLRFAEQGWQTLYYTMQWIYGVVRTLSVLFNAFFPISLQYIYRNVPNMLADPWSNYPHIPLPSVVKGYYLMQIAFYVHAVLIINAEARRKDHWQMMTHHVITIALVIISYSYNFTRVGCLIMVIMDWCDITLTVCS